MGVYACINLHESTADHLKILLEKDPGNTEKNHEKSVPE
jgi:hypothetical protein